MNRNIFCIITITMGWLTANSLNAAPPTPPFSQSGTVVTTPDAQGSYTHSHFVDTSTGYSVLVNPVAGQTLTLLNNGRVISVGDNSSVIIGGSTTLSSSNNVAVIKITGSGTVTTSSASTLNGYNGINVTGAGTVTNSGTINAANIGIQVKNGTVINTGTILTGGGPAITGYTGTTTIINQGVIAGAYGVGSNGNLVLNNSDIIFATNTAVGAGGNASITNTGTIIALGTALQLGKNATVNNSGSIFGFDVGVEINKMGTLTNTGTIFGLSVAGVLMNKGTVTNYGTIESNSEGLVINNSGTVNNLGFISGNNVGVAVIGKSTVVNTGAISSTDGIGLYLDNGGTITNAGLISASTDGIEAPGTTTINNSGVIIAVSGAGIAGGKGTLTNSNYIFGGDVGVDFTGAATISNSGIIGGTSGAGILAEKKATILLQGGEVDGSAGDAIIVNDNGGAKSTVTIQGRSELGGRIVSNGNLGTLNVNLVGMTPAEAAYINSLNGKNHGNFFVGSDEYQWTHMNLVAHAVSLEMVVDSGLRDVATRIDNNTLPMAFDPLYVAAAYNPEAALNSLTGREFLNAFNQVGLSSATTLSAMADERAFSIRSGATGVDLSGLNVNSNSLIASLGNVQNILSHMSISDMGGTTMSDSKEAMFSNAPDRPWGVWASGAVTIGSNSGSFSDPAYHTTVGSPTIGFDYHLFPEFVVGALVNYTTTGAYFSDGSNLNADTILFGGYADWMHQNWFVNGLVAGGFNSYDQSRTTLGGNLAQASPDGSEVLANISSGYDFKFGSWMVSPEAGLNYTHLEKDAYSETGDGVFGLNVGEQDVNSLRTKLGVNVTNIFKWNGMKLAPEIHASWYHECLDDTTGISTSLAGAPALGSFVTTTTPMGRNFALVGGGLSVTPDMLKDAVTFFLSYDAQVGQDNYISHTGEGGLRIGF